MQGSTSVLHQLFLDCVQQTLELLVPCVVVVKHTNDGCQLDLNGRFGGIYIHASLGILVLFKAVNGLHCILIAVQV